MTPPADLPPPIRTDASNAFAHDTMHRRVPETVGQILAHNPDYPDRIRRALNELAVLIAADTPLPAPMWSDVDRDDWGQLWGEHAGQTWLGTGWFFAETYFYRLVIDRVRWWETGRDPFAPIKDAAYDAALWQALAAHLDALDAAPDAETALHRASLGALWGNRMDLSFAASLERGTTAAADDLLADDSASLVDYLLRQDPASVRAVHIVLDNVGAELSHDLALADWLLRDGRFSVWLHVKLHPTFVSDATAADVRDWLARAGQQGGPAGVLAGRLQAAFDDARLRLLPHLFWNSGRFMWQMPRYLLARFGRAALTIVKGDANYRRLVGDALWPVGVPFAAVAATWPTPLLALRTLKSDPLLGVDPARAAALDAIEPGWRVNGRYGVLQVNLNP